MRTGTMDQVEGTYTHTVALFVIGGSSAILTETLAAYASEEEPFIPRKICITTTHEGKRRLKASFLMKTVGRDWSGNKVTLIDTPFIRLRSHVTSALAKADISSLLQSAQTAIDLAAQYPLILHIKHQAVEYLDKIFEFPEREFSCLLPERIREAVKEAFGADPRAGIAWILNPGKRGSPAYGLMADKNQIRIESD